MKNEVTRRATISGLMGAATAGNITAAQLAAETAVGASNFYPTSTHGSVAAAIAAGETATAIGSAFSVDDGSGNLIYFVRIEGGSSEIARTISPAALADPAIGPGLIGLQQDSPRAIVRTIRDQMLDIWSIEQFVPTAELAAIRAMASTFDMSERLADVIGTIQDLRPYGLLTSGGGKLRCNKTLALDAYRIQTGLRCIIDMTENNDEFGVIIGSSGPGGATTDRRARIDGLNLIGGDAVSKQQTAIALFPDIVGGGQLNQLSLTNLSLSNWYNMVVVGNDTYCVEIDSFLFNVGVYGLKAPGEMNGKPVNNAGERITLKSGTMAGVENGIFNDNDFCNIYVRSVSIDYPVKFTAGPCWAYARRGVIELCHFHGEGNNETSPMIDAKPFRMGKSSSALLAIRGGKCLAAKQWGDDYVFINENQFRPMIVHDLEVFNLFGRGGYMASGLVDLRLNPTTSPQTFMGYHGSNHPTANLNIDDFAGVHLKPRVFCITDARETAAATTSFVARNTHLSVTTTNFRSGSGCLIYTKESGVGSESTFAGYFGITPSAICGVEFWVSKPVGSSMAGTLLANIAWVAGYWDERDLFVEQKIQSIFEGFVAIAKLPSGAMDWTPCSMGGLNVRAPDWAGFFKVEINGVQASAGALLIDDFRVTRAR